MKNLKQYKTILYASRLNISLKLKNKSKFIPSAFGFFAPLPSLLLEQKPSQKQKKPFIRHSRLIAKQRQLIPIFSLKNKNSFISPFAGSSNNYWKKRISAAYFLLIAYKQTARAKFKLYLNSSTNTQLFLALSPFLIYFIQTSLERYDLKFQSDSFIERSLPQWNFGTPSQKLTWETFAYTKYSNKLNAHSIKEINHFDNSIFISLNPVWQLEQKQFYFRPLDSAAAELMTTNKSFLSSRYFFQFHSLISEKKLSFPLKSHGPSLISQKQTNLGFPQQVGVVAKEPQTQLQSPFFQWGNLDRKLKLNIEWQFFFDELDDIPMKLSSVFYETPSFFEPSETNLEIKPLFSFIDGEAHLHTESGLSNQTYLNHFETTPSFSNEKAKAKIPFNTKEIILEKDSGLDSSCIPLKQTWIDLLNETFFGGFKKSENPLFTERAFHYNIDFGLSTFAKFPKLLALQPITLKSADSVKKTVSLEKTNDKKLSSFDSLLQNASLNWKGVIRQDLHTPSPLWAFDLKMSESAFLGKKGSKGTTVAKQLLGLNANSIDITLNQPSGIDLTLNQPSDINKVLPHSNKKAKKMGRTTELVKIQKFENLFLKQLKLRFNDSLIDSVLADPESVLALLKKTTLSKSQTVPFFHIDKTTQNKKAKELLNFAKNNFSKDLNEHFLTQRKLSGYLYPDSSRTNISLNLNRFQGSNSLELHKLLKDSEIIPTHSLKNEKPFVFQTNKWNQIKPKIWKGFYSSSLIQIDQPLLPLISNQKIDKVDFKPQHLSGLKLQKTGFSQKNESQNIIPKKSILDWIPSNPLAFHFFSKDVPNGISSKPKQPLVFPLGKEGAFEWPIFQIKPDSSLTSNQDFFFAGPTNRVMYKKRPVSRTNVVKPIMKSERRVPYIRFSEEILRLTKLVEHDLAINTFQIFQEALSNKSRVTEEKLTFVAAPEATKENLFSVVMKENNLNRLFLEQKPIQIKNFKGLREKTLDLISSPLSYKSRFHSTPAKKVQFPLFFDNLSLLRSSSEKISSLNNPLFKGNSSLYEPLSLKTWSVLSQLGFLFLLFKVLLFIKDEYIEEWNYYLKDFEGFIDDAGESLLEIPTQSENFRVIEKTPKKFSDLVGGRFLLNEFGDIILSLRNSRKLFSKIPIAQPKPLKDGVLNQQESSLLNSNGFKMEDLTSKGILLIGPPGTGKTLLVQALSGEANVPIIIESGKRLNSTLEMPGVERLKDLFQKARTMSPCLLFLDEIDTIGQKRSNVISSLSSLDKQTEIPNIFNLLYFQNTPTSASTENGLNKIDKTGSTSFSKSTWNSLNPLLQSQIKSPSTKKINKNHISEEQQIKDFQIQISDEQIVRGENQERDLIMLTQLLCELDGLNQRKNVIVIGATNRPATLDSALIRPGRLGQIIYLDLPGKQKRLDLLKFYSHLGVEDSINWDYFANQTVGLSAAHLSAAMNRSALKTIYSFLYRKKNKSNFAATLTQIVKSSSVEKKRAVVRGSGTFSNFVATQQSKGEKAKATAKGFLKKASNPFALISPKQKQPQHTFETIEYGIQTVSTINTNSQQAFIKGKQTNQKTFGHMFPLFLAHSSESNKKFLLKSTKLDVIVNSIFNQPHFLSILNIWAFALPLPFLNEKQGGKEIKPFKKSLRSFAILVDNLVITRRPETKNLKFKSNNAKKSLEKRKVFYTKQRQYLRTLALLENRNDKFKKNSLLINQKSKISPARSFAVRENGFYLNRLNLLDRYLSRITENQFFGWLFLFNSTCAIHNPLFLTSFQLKFWSLQTQKPNQAQMQQKKNFLYYNILSLDSVGKLDSLDSCAKTSSPFFSTSSIFHPDKLKTGSSLKTLLMWQNNHLTNQINLFGDSLFLNRSAYYLSGKSIINLVTKQVIPNKLDQPVYLWSFITSTQVRQKSKTYDYLSKNKLEFEKVLLSFIAGKASETLMLKNQIGILKQNNSDIGTNELKEFSVLIRLMIDKYLFYSQKRVTRKQVNRNFLANRLQTQQNDESFLQKLTNLFENQDAKNNLSANSSSPFYDEFQLGDTPWWQLKSSQLLTANNLKYNEWYRLFLINPEQNLRNIEWISPDSFYHNQVNNRYLISNQMKLSNLDLEKEFNHFFINREIVLKYIVFSNLNWNQLQLLEFDFLTTSFIFESFNKAFSLLESHRELLDVLVYSLFCQEKMKEFQMKKGYEHFIK